MLEELRKKSEKIKRARRRDEKKAIADTLSPAERRLLALEFSFTGLGPKILESIREKEGKDMPVEDVIEIFERASKYSSSKRKKQIISEIVVDPKLKEFLIAVLTGTLALNFKFEAGEPRLACPIKPQLCANKPFNIEDSLIELKYDGMRIIAHRTEDEVILFSRAGNRVTIEKVEEDLRRLPPGTILDGEVVGSNLADLQSLKRHEKASYITFDCLMIEGEYIYNRPLVERREYIPGGVQVSEILDFGSMQEIVDFLKETEVEGVVAKDPFAPYSPGKRDWYKFKLMKETTVQVVGYTEGKGKREGTLGAIIVESPTISKTKVGSGFSDTDLDVMLNRLRAGIPTYVDVQYQSLTKDGKMRFPVFLKIRDDL